MDVVEHFADTGFLAKIVRMAHVRGHGEIYGGDEGLRHHLCFSHGEHRDQGTSPDELESLHQEEHDAIGSRHLGEYTCPDREHEEENEPDEWDELHKDIGPIHRGIGIHLPDELHDFVHDRRRRPEDRARALLDHIRGHRWGIGVHWSTSPDVAESFGESNARGGTDRKPGTSVVLHAAEPAREHIDTDIYSDPTVYRHGSSEREVPLISGEDADITGISWAPVHRDDMHPRNKVYEHHDFGGHESREASAQEPEGDLVDLYHHTHPESVDSIYHDRRFYPGTDEDRVYFTNMPSGGSGDSDYGTGVVHLRMPRHLVHDWGADPHGEHYYDVDPDDIRPEHFVDPNPATIRAEGTSQPAERPAVSAQAAEHTAAAQADDLLGHFEVAGIRHWDDKTAGGVYLRFGDWPTDERSRNNITGFREEGVSVYDLDHHGNPRDPDPGGDRWHAHGPDCEPDCEEDQWNDERGNDTGDEMRGRVHRAERNRYNGRDLPSETGHLVRGEMIGLGGDAEPLLNNVRRVGDWIDHRHLFIPGAERHRLARDPSDEDYEPPEEEPQHRTAAARPDDAIHLPGGSALVEGQDCPGCGHHVTKYKGVWWNSDDTPHDCDDEQFRREQGWKTGPRSAEAAAAPGPHPLPMEPGLYYRTHHKDAPFGREHASTQNIGEPPHPDLAKYWEPKPGYSAFWNPHHLNQYHEEMGWSGDKDAMKGRRVLMFRGTPVGEGADGEPRVMPGSDKPEASMSWGQFQKRLDVTQNGYGSWHEHTWGEGPHGQMVDDGYRTIGGDYHTAAARPGRGEKTCKCCAGNGEHKDGSECDPCDGQGIVHKEEPDFWCNGQPQPKRRHWRQKTADVPAREYSAGRMLVSDIRRPGEGRLSERPYTQRELADDIRRNGVQQPLAIEDLPAHGGPTTFNGLHRLDAAERAGVRDVPVVVKHMPGKPPAMTEHRPSTEAEFNAAYDLERSGRWAGEDEQVQRTAAYVPAAERTESVQHILSRYLPSDFDTWDEVRDNLDFDNPEGRPAKLIGDIADHGVKRPIPIDYEQDPPRVMNGHTRLIAADLAGISHVPTRQHKGWMDPDDPDAYGHQPDDPKHWTHKHPEWLDQHEASIDVLADAGDEPSDYKDIRGGAGMDDEREPERDYGHWPETLRQLRYRKRNEPEMHRGMAVTLPPDVYAMVTDRFQGPPHRQARAIAEHLRAQGLGTHWSTDSGVSRDFAKFEHGKQPGSLKVIVHARLPELEHIETDPDKLREGAVFGHDNFLAGEKEIPLREGAPVHVTGITWYGDRNRKVRGDVYGMEHLAVSAPTAPEPDAEPLGYLVEASGNGDYRMQHRGPDADDGEAMHEVGSGRVYPADIHEHPDWYIGSDGPGAWDSWDKVRKSKDWPSRRVTMYRSLPSPHREINTGDWVTSSADYAREHGRMSDPADDWPVVKFEARADQLRTAGDSINEWSYHGPPISRARVHYRGGKNHWGALPPGKTDDRVSEHEPPEMYSAYEAQNAERRRRRREERQQREADFKVAEGSSPAENCLEVVAHFEQAAATPEYGPKPEHDWRGLNARSEDPDYQETAERWHGEDKAWESGIRRGLSLGHIDFDRAKELGYHPNGHEVRNGGWGGLQSKWAPLPQEMYHVTTDLPGVRASGGLKTREELGQHMRGGHGLGGGESDTISVTTDPELARGLLRGLHEYHHFINHGDPAALLDAARRGEGASRPYHAPVIAQYGRSDWKDGDELPWRLHAILRGKTAERSAMAGKNDEEMAAEGWHPSPHPDNYGWTAPKGSFHTIYERDATPEEKLHDRSYLYKQFSFARDHAGGPPDPMFFTNDEKGFAARNPAHFGLLHLRPRPGAQGYPVSGMSEWRTASGDALEVHRAERLENGHLKEASVSLAARYEPGLPNPATGGQEWFHGTHARPEELHRGFYHFEPESHEEQELRGHLSYWNTHLGSHWAADHGLAEHFARSGASISDDADEEYREPSSRYEEATPNAVVHAKLHLRNPKVYASEHDMDNEAYEHETGRGNWIAHHFEGYEDEDFRHPDWDPTEVGYGEEWPLAARFRHDKDEPLIGPDEAPHQTIFNPHHYGQRMRAQWLSSHPDKSGIVERFRQRLIDAGHDGIIYGNELERDHVHGGEAGARCAIAFHPHQVEITQHHEEQRPCLSPAEAEMQRRRMPQRGQEELPGFEDHPERFTGHAVIAHFEPPRTAAPYHMQQKLFHVQPDPRLHREDSGRHNPDDPEAGYRYRREHDEEYQPDECPECGGDRHFREQHAEEHEAYLHDQDWYTDWEGMDMPSHIHRGMAVHLPQGLHDYVHDESVPVADRAGALARHVAGEQDAPNSLGHYWSESPDQSKGYAEHRKSWLRPGPGEAGEHTPVMVHAEFPGREHIETDPETLQHWKVLKYGYGRDNLEYPIKEDAPIHLTGISWARPGHRHHDYDFPLERDDAWTHHEFGGEGIRAHASGGDPAEALEVLAHFAQNPPCHYCGEPLDDDDVRDGASAHEECSDMRWCEPHQEHHDDPAEAEEHNSTYTDWGGHLPFDGGIHRGVTVRLPPEVHAIVHDESRPGPERAGVLSRHLRENPLGVHWTDHEPVARAWGSGEGAMFGPSEHERSDPSWTHVVVHAASPDYEHIETDPHVLSGRNMLGFDHRRSEREIPLRDDAPVTLTGLSWKRAGTPDDAWQRHDLPQPHQHTAALGATTEDRSGDRYVTCGQGHAHWGAHGAAGLLCRHTDDQGVTRYLLQQRSPEVHEGGTWSTPGGALLSGEDPETGARREAEEEFGSLPAGVTHSHTFVDDHGGWKYHTVVMDSPVRFRPGGGDEDSEWESEGHRWVTPEQMRSLPLHPGFAASWDRVRKSGALEVTAAAQPGDGPGGVWQHHAAALDHGNDGLDWEEIADRHPALYGDPETHGEDASEDGNNIADAAAHLYHDRPGHPYSETYGEMNPAYGGGDMKFYPRSVDPERIDYARHGCSDPRVAEARKGYQSQTPERVPPLILVHRNGVFMPADGHHRAEGAALAHKLVRAYVAYSPHDDEPFSDGDRGPFHGAETEDREPFPDQNGIRRRMNYPGFPHAADIGHPARHYSSLEVAAMNHEDMNEAQLRQHMRGRHGFIDSPEDPDWVIEEAHRNEHADAPLEHSHPDLTSTPEWDEEVGVNLGDKDFLHQHGVEAVLEAAAVNDDGIDVVAHFGNGDPAFGSVQVPLYHARPSAIPLEPGGMTSTPDDDGYHRVTTRRNYAEDVATAGGNLPGYVYHVEPTGPVEPDGRYHMRSRHPFRVTERHVADAGVDNPEELLAALREHEENGPDEGINHADAFTMHPRGGHDPVFGALQDGSEVVAHFEAQAAVPEVPPAENLMHRPHAGPIDPVFGAALAGPRLGAAEPAQPGDRTYRSERDVRERHIEDWLARQRTGRGWETELIPNRHFVANPALPNGGVTHLMRGYMNGKLVGTIGAGASDNMKAWKVHNVHVVPGHRPEDVSASLMDSFYDHARELGARWIDHGIKSTRDGDLWRDYTPPHPEMNIHNAHPAEGWNEYFSPGRVHREMATNAWNFSDSSHLPEWESSDNLYRVTSKRWNRARGLAVNPHHGEWPERPVNDFQEELHSPGGWAQHLRDAQRDFHYNRRAEIPEHPEAESGGSSYGFMGPLPRMHAAPHPALDDALQSARSARRPMFVTPAGTGENVRYHVSEAPHRWRAHLGVTPEGSWWKRMSGAYHDLPGHPSPEDVASVRGRAAENELQDADHTAALVAHFEDESAAGPPQPVVRPQSRTQEKMVLAHSVTDQVARPALPAGKLSAAPLSSWEPSGEDEMREMIAQVPVFLRAIGDGLRRGASKADDLPVHPSLPDGFRRMAAGCDSAAEDAQLLMRSTEGAWETPKA